MYKIVVIEVRGGVAEATVIPEDVQVIIKDYDWGGANPENLEIDENGNKYILTSS